MLPGSTRLTIPVNVASPFQVIVPLPVPLESATGDLQAVLTNRSGRIYAIIDTVGRSRERYRITIYLSVHRINVGAVFTLYH